MRYVLVTYDRSHDAMDAADALQKAGIVGPVLVPRPRTVSASCGVALRMEADVAPRALQELMAAGLLGEVYCSEDRRSWERCDAQEIVAQGEGYGRARS